MNIEYSKQGDYYIPNIVAQKNTKDFILGKYGRMRLRFLKEHKKAEYTILLMNNKLQSHLIETDESANNILPIVNYKSLSIVNYKSFYFYVNIW